MNHAPSRSQRPRRLLPATLCLALAAASLTACAQDQAATDAAAADADAPATAAEIAAGAEPEYPAGTAEANAREAIRTIAPQLRVDRIGPAPIDGFRQAIVGGQVIYISDDGKHLLQGTLLDVAGRKDLNEVAMSDLRRDLLATIPASDRIVFAPEAAPEYTVTVFTDVDCGYCRQLHGEMDQYHAAGIAVEYLAFPRMGPGSENFDEMVAVWCADDPRDALTKAKAGGEVRGTCTSPVAMQYALGQRLGLTGTPMIVAEDGSQLGGYVPAKRLRQMLDERFAAATPAAATPEPAPAATEAVPADAPAGSR